MTAAQRITLGVLSVIAAFRGEWMLALVLAVLSW